MRECNEEYQRGDSHRSTETRRYADVKAKGHGLWVETSQQSGFIASKGHQVARTAQAIRKAYVFRTHRDIAFIREPQALKAGARHVSSQDTMHVI